MNAKAKATARISTVEQDALMKEYAALERKMQPIADRMAEIEEAFRELPQDTYYTRHGQVVVSPNTRFDANMAVEMLSERSLNRVLVLKVDSNLVKKNFPGVYRKARKQFDNRVTMKAVARQLKLVEFN